MQVCFARNDLSLYLFLLFILVAFIVYISVSSFRESRSESFTPFAVGKGMTNAELQKRILQLQEQLQATQVAEQQCKIDLIRSQQEQQIAQPRQLYNKIYNPLVSPDRIYQNPLGGNAFHNYQMVGFIYNGDIRYPLFGRYKYSGRSDRWEYYVMDETRNRLKIPFKSPNDNELFDGDTVVIPELGGNFNVKIYEYETLRYNPNVL